MKTEELWQKRATHYRAIRKKLGLTQAQLARMLAIHRVTIADRERGEKRITLEAEYALKHLEENWSQFKKKIPQGRIPK